MNELKVWCFKHPLMAFLLADSLVSVIGRVALAACGVRDASD